MRSARWTAGISIAILAMALSAAAAEEFYVDSQGNMRRLPAHGWSTGPVDPVPEDYIPSRPVVRGSPEELLRALVPSYDDPEWQAEGGRVLRYRGAIEDPYGGQAVAPYDGNDPLYGPGDVSRNPTTASTTGPPVSPTVTSPVASPAMPPPSARPWPTSTPRRGLPRSARPTPIS